MNVELKSIEITSFTIAQPRIDRSITGTVSMNILPIVGIFKLPALPGFQVAIDIYGRYRTSEIPETKFDLFLTCTTLFNFMVDEYESIITEEKKQESNELFSMMISVAYSTIRGIIYERTHSTVPDLILPLTTPQNIPAQLVNDESIDQYFKDKENFVRSLLMEDQEEA